MQVSGDLKIGLCGNHTCETVAYLQAYIVPECYRMKINRGAIYKVNNTKEVVRGPIKAISNPFAVIKTRTTIQTPIITTYNTTEPFFSAPIISYSCINYLCRNKTLNDRHFHHFPFCDDCLGACANLRRGYIDDVTGYGLFPTVKIESGSVILCETITNDFYDIVSLSDLELRYGKLLSQTSKSSLANKLPEFPYVSKIPVSDTLSLYLDQTTKRGVSSLLNYGNDVDSSNCVLDFEVSDYQIVLRVTTCKTVNANEELKYTNLNDRLFSPMKGQTEIFVDYTCI
jgi:hypothetical protein